MQNVVLAAGLFVFLAHLLEIVFQRTRVPDILMLMLLGVLAGPIAGLVDLAALGRVGDFLATVTLVVILTESGTSLRIKTLLSAAGRATPFALLSMIGALALLAGVLWVFIDPYPFAVPPWMHTRISGWTAMLGAFILGGTSSAVVIPMLKGLGTSDGTTTTLTLESALTDVLCIIGAVGIATALAEGEGVAAGGLLGRAAFSLGAAGVLGALAGVAWTVVFSMTERMRSARLTTLAFALVLFGVAELMGVSGAIAALAFGITLGNLPAGTTVRIGSSDGRAFRVTFKAVGSVEKEVYAEIVFLLKAFFFFYLGLNVRPGDFLSLLGVAALILAVVPFLPRLFAVRWLMPKTTTSRKEATIAWALVPRGLAAAVLAQIPVQLGLAGGQEIAITVAMMVFLSISIVAVLVLLTERGTLDTFSARAFGKFPRVVATTPAVADASHDDAPQGGLHAAGEDDEGRRNADLSAGSAGALAESGPGLHEAAEAVGGGAAATQAPQGDEPEPDPEPEPEPSAGSEASGDASDGEGPKTI